MRSRLRPAISRSAPALVALVLIGGCGSDDEGVDDTLPPVVTTTTVATTLPVTPPPTTVAVTLPPTPPPTVATTTSTTEAPTTTAGETTTSSTEPPAGAELVLRDNSIGDAVFGADPDEVVGYVASLIGPPDADTGWADPFSAFGVCPGTEVRGVTWDDLTLLFTDSSVITSGRRHFFTYEYGPAFGAEVEPAGPRTATGITVGSTVADLKAAYPGVELTAADDIFEARFAINDSFTGFLTGVDDGDTVRSIQGGIGCGE